MLGEQFFATGYELIKATSFSRVAELLLNELRPLVGASEIMLYDIAADYSTVRVIGDGSLAQELRRDLESVRLWVGEHFRNCPNDVGPISGGPGGKPLSEIPEVAGWISANGLADIVGGNLMHGEYRSATMAIVRKERRFNSEERERIQAAVLVCTSVLLRLLNENYEIRVLERLMHTRKETTNAVFVIQKGQVIPYNPGAVGYADACWEKDDVEYTLAAEARAHLTSRIIAACTTPVDSQWVDLDLDIGGGPIRVGAMARPDGNVILLFPPPPRQFVPGTVPMLTRRQCDIMDWIAEGKTSAEVAIILEISPRTVEKHLEAVFQRFGVENRVAAVRTYLEAKGGILPGHMGPS